MNGARPTKEREVTYRLRLREPVTYRLLAEACAALGLDPDKVLDDTRAELGDASPTVDQYAAFLKIVCAPPPWWASWRRKVPDLTEIPVDEAVALGAWAASDFFSAVWMKSAARRPDYLLRSLLALGSQTPTGVLSG